jgi:RNA polymerase sigma factor (sigma-70 family)
MMNMVDTGIISGEQPQDSFDEIEAVLRPQVLRMMLCRVSVEDAQDVTQRVFAIVFKKFGSFHGASSRRTWVFGIAERELRAWRRENFRRGPVVQADIANPWPSATAGVVLRDAILKLSEAQAGAFVMMEVEGLSVREIAEIQGVPEGTVLSRLHAARKRLREILKDGDLV